ncbi:MAG: NUDIX domain-containing protein [Acidimicrobiales bacterium]
MSEAPAIALRDAATVMLVRDGDDGRLEVFMLRRNLRSDFVGGAYVFPGGAVDPEDRHADLEPICEGRTDAEASMVLALDPPEGGLAFWVAAIRESFEEAGVLLAYDGGGEVVDLRDPSVAERFVRHRRAVDGGERRLSDVCAEEDLRLAVDGIHYFSHWITPVGPPRRYDTRFFVAAAPVGQVPLHDDRETIANCWIAPSDALARHEAGEFDLILPTIRNLDAIARFATAAEVLAAAAALDQVPAVLPRIIGDGRGIRIVLPGDEGYDEASHDLPLDMPLPGRPGGPAT